MEGGVTFCFSIPPTTKRVLKLAVKRDKQTEKKWKYGLGSRDHPVDPFRRRDRRPYDDGTAESGQEGNKLFEIWATVDSNWHDQGKFESNELLYG